MNKQDKSIELIKNMCNLLDEKSKKEMEPIIKNLEESLNEKVKKDGNK